MAFMAVVPYLLQAASLAGGILGKERKHIDPEYMKRMFGSEAIAKEATEIANRIINSPYGQKLLASAAESGQQFQNAVNQGAADAGLGPGGGASSGTGIFATSAAPQAQAAFERGVRGDIYQAALPIAANSVGARQSAYLSDFQSGGVPTDRANVWGTVGEAAGLAAASIPQKTSTSKTTPEKAPEVTVAGGRGPGAATSTLAPTEESQSSQALKSLAARRQSMAATGNTGAVQRRRGWLSFFRGGR